MDKGHRFYQHQPYNNLSPFLLERMLFISQSVPYEEAVVVLQYFLGIDTNATALFRLSNHYGAQSSEIMERETIGREVPVTGFVYAQSDGSMVLTREGDVKAKDAAGTPTDNDARQEYQTSSRELKKTVKDGNWKEVKLCRLYHSSAKLSTDHRSWIEHSQYVGSLGCLQEFKRKAEHLIDPYEKLNERLVFISDGASWIHKWQRENYPKATQILDLFHACEHLSAFIQLVIEDDSERKQWFKARKDELMESNLKAVIACIQEISKHKSKIIRKKASNLVEYYRKNEMRMDYKTYLEKGMQIGSGAIEAAHRTVVQRRLKLSGQRWSKQGAQNILNLRVCFMSGRWDELVKIIRSTAA